MLRTVACTAACLALVAACTVGDPNAPQPDEAQTLQLSQNDATTVAGTFVYAGSVIDFRSTSADQNKVDVHLNVNGAELDIAYDLAARTMDRDGKSNALFRDELDALYELRDALSRDYGADLAATVQGYVLLRQVDRLAEAPVGYTFVHRVVSVKKGLTVATKSRDISSKSSPCGDDGVTCLPGTSGNAYAIFDTGDHGTCWGWWRPYGNSWCAGRCGAGCAGDDWYELISDDDYTWDCLDHDWCTVYFNEGNGPGASNCGDEFDEAADDYIATIGNAC